MFVLLILGAITNYLVPDPLSDALLSGHRQPRLQNTLRYSRRPRLVPFRRQTAQASRLLCGWYFIFEVKKFLKIVVVFLKVVVFLQFVLYFFYITLIKEP